MSLRARMGVVAGAAVAIAVLAVAVSAYAGTRSDLLGQLDQSLSNLSAQVTHAPPPPPGAPPATQDPDEGLGLDARPGPAFGGASGTFTLVRGDGSTYVPRGQRYQIPVSGHAAALAAKGSGRYFTDMTVSGTHIRVLVSGIGPRGALMVALPRTDVDHTLHRQLLLLVLIAAGGIGLAALLGVLVARAVVVPIERFTSQTEALAARPERIEEERLQVTGSDELARLARTFNSTLDALERSVNSQRNLVADASHELRTPIATIRANLQLMRDEGRLSEADRNALRADVIEELDELTALVGDIVELARGSRPGEEADAVRLDAILSEAVERARRRYPEVRLQVRAQPTLVRAEGDRIARAVANLLDNARKWSPPGGLVEVELREGTLTVRDHGPGFPEQDLAFVFDRFYRTKEARSKPGSGLGLAIVRQAAEAHGGSAQAGNAPGGGAVIRVSFGPQLELPAEGGQEAPAEPTDPVGAP